MSVSDIKAHSDLLIQHHKACTLHDCSC